MPENKPGVKSILEQIGRLAFWLSIPDLSATGLIVSLAGLARPNPIRDLQIIWGVFVATFPLTVAVAFLVYLHKQGDLNVSSGSLTIIIAFFLGDLLHLGNQSGAALPSGSLSGGWGMLGFVVGVLNVYLTRYGLLLFLKSWVLGYVLGRKLS